MRVAEIYNEIIEEPCIDGFTYTGETIKIAYDIGRNREIFRTLHVLKGDYTPQFELRDCGDHYIKANFSTFDYIDKETLHIEKDVQDD